MSTVSLPRPRPVDYWSPATERLARPELEALQLKKLRTLLAWAMARSPFWARKLGEAGVGPERFRSLDDLRRLPFLTKEELLADQAASPPYGTAITCSPRLAVASHHTSGTTGRTPLRVFETRRDWDWGADAWARALYAFGLRASDVVYFPFGYGPFIGFWGAHYAVQKIGATTVAGGGQSSEHRLRQIVDCGATAVVATPSYALRLAAVAEQQGLDLATGTRVELLIHAGEPGASIPATKALIERKWGAYAGDFAGMTETAGISAFECAARSGGIHIAEDHFIEEVVDPATGEPVPPGEPGERVTTALGIGSLPIIRYRTRDLVRRVSAHSCPCGRGFDLYQGGILGRTDDMRIVRGTNVHPSAVEGVVRRFEEIREFRLVLSRGPDLQDEVAVELEPLPHVPAEAGPALAARIADELAYAHEGLRFRTRLVEPGTLPIFELKARRLVD
ncbi:MAG: AMP-binding protein, partial [Chloroflexi bacterium]|nr:AMP-binding protein [Chloroflexota bacterium]